MEYEYTVKTELNILELNEVIGTGIDICAENLYSNRDKNKKIIVSISTDNFNQPSMEDMIKTFTAKGVM